MVRVKTAQEASQALPVEVIDKKVIKVDNIERKVDAAFDANES